MDEGAGILLPVAGPVGVGTVSSVQESERVFIIGVDADWRYTNPQFRDITLTSIMKLMDTTTYDVIKAVVDGTFTGVIIEGTQENNGIGLAPFHELDRLVNDELKAGLDALYIQIIQGEIQASP
jgi:basic membrane protein A